MDDTYSTDYCPKYSTAAAWYLTTRVARRVLLEISCYRNGVYHMFRTGDNLQICKTLFWSFYRTAHNLMSRFVLSSFNDDPWISSEIDKFLAMSSGTKDVEVLNTKLSTVIWIFIL